MSNDPVPAPLGVRVAARALDTLVLVAIDVALGLAMGFDVAWLVVGAAVVFAYFTVADAFFGATVGKAMLGLRVRGGRRERPTLAEAAAREAFTLIGAVPFVGPLLALAAWSTLAVQIRRTGSGLHDRLAGGTQVVRRS